MFERVLLPAPFSPSSACTSPAAASKSTPSLATTPGNRFVTPRSETADIVVGSVRRGPEAPRRRRSALRASLDALDEPVDRVELLHGQLGALRHRELPGLVVDRTRELVEA